jgi:Peptidase_C39 like family/Tetratricopeptide repeat
MSLGPVRARAPLALITGLGALLLLGACATPQVSQLGMAEERSREATQTTGQAGTPALPMAAAVTGVPFFPQTQYHCGPAALAMVAQHAGIAVQPDDLTDQVYLPGRQGSLQVEMLVASRRQGLLAYPLAPRLDDMLREVAAGNPVVVLQNLAFNFSPLWHYAVVIGYDRERNRIILHSGLTERLELSLYTFERTWARGQYWSMVALDPSRVPVTAEADAFMSAAASLERVQPQAAQTAYASALKRWPLHRAGMLGAGNAAYAAGHLDLASEAFAKAVTAHPDFAEAWNNLAQVRFEQGRLAEAAQAIDRAVGLGGARTERYRALQSSIRSRLSGAASQPG